MLTQYQEKQYMRKWWTHALVIVLALLAWWSFISQIFFDTPIGTDPAPDWAMYIIVLLVGIGLPWLLLSAHLRIVVTEDTLRIRYFPFMDKHIPRKDIQSAESITFHPIREHGGWGIRYSFQGVPVYTAQGTSGVQLTFADGKKLIIGSQRAEELTHALQR